MTIDELKEAVFAARRNRIMAAQNHEEAKHRLTQARETEDMRLQAVFKAQQLEATADSALDEALLEQLTEVGAE